MLKSFLIALAFTLGVCGAGAFLVWLIITSVIGFVCLMGVVIFTGIWSMVHAYLYE